MAASTIESTHPEEHPYHQGLASKWPLALDLAGSNQPCRLEGSIADLPVLGTLPPEIDGTFYRVMCDPFVPPHPSNVPIDGDGSISAFRVRGGRVDMRMAYVHTERYLLERRRGARLFGLYRNPFTHHPCVRAAVDSTANTNLVLWAGQLLALKEVALPYAVDPHTLATRRRVHDNAFPFFPSEDGRMPAPDAKADYVRWELDLSKPSDTQIPDPQVILDVPTEFPRIDERFIAKRINIFWADVFLPERSDGGKNIFHGLNALAMHNHETGQTRFYYAGDDSLVQEPVFIPRSDDAVEGDGWVMAMVERRKANRNDLVVIDTREFEKAVAIVQLPLHVKAQIHGNWVDAKDLGEWKSLVDEIPEMKISGKGALEPLI
ncbi:Carotenoid oxygenase [Macrophomina phaseolina MS6]|uniref:Carotenoid oxygenase n=1 Tax=Macrophomina phaseolina (strain MS6) TaxID=1126212 RepID=K2R9J2_MACPH|nr:Carotenoid oxygenase [Macrophomina phaseolina MS6]